ncbi:MAG: DNA primase small subunit domain-containing protein [Candidatus Hodarchaeales archaeon]|jgi:DNA primase small subunit
MSDIRYLNRLFRDYYRNKIMKLPLVNSFNEREFGFIPWDNQIRMIRHMSFSSRENLMKNLFNNGPRHVYSSGALYQQPENQDMEGKGFKGCDLIIDIDADHFYTPCKEDHDLWFCKECGESGQGTVIKCPNCKNSKFKNLTWICEECLDIAKNEIIKLIYDFLIPDFGIDLSHIKIAFSGHRGYHLKIENDQIRSLSSDERRELADYISGENISLEILGFQAKGRTFYRFSEDTIGWAQKIIRKTVEILKKPDKDIQNLLAKNQNFKFNRNYIKSFINSKQDFLNKIKETKRFILPSIEGFGMTNWKNFFTGVVHELGVEIDTPVTIDIHRLIRYPGSLHGKTGFKVQELLPDEIEDFNPLDERVERLDPIVFKSKVHTTQKLEILENQVPITKIKGEKFGPYLKGDIIEVPHHIAIFLLCKEVAKTI